MTSKHSHDELVGGLPAGAAECGGGDLTALVIQALGLILGKLVRDEGGIGGIGGSGGIATKR